MKKITRILLVLSFILILTGCTKKEENKVEEKVPANLKVVTENIYEAKLNNDGNIVIEKYDVTDKAMYISYKVDDVTIGLIAVRDSTGEIKVVVNTCTSCGGSPYAYFVQVGDKLQCQNCGNLFDIDSLDEIEEDGCNPILIVERYDTDTEIIIGVEQLNKL